MRPGRGRLHLVLFLILLPINPLLAQGVTGPQEQQQTVRLFLDCNAMACFNMDFLRTEIPFVNWVRDRQDGDVYLLITQQGTGAGGSSSELIFTGQGRFQGMADTLTFVSPPNSTTDAQREGLAGIMKIGLMRYVGLTPQASEIRIGMAQRVPGPAGPGRREPVGAPEDDPWNFWVFSVRGSGSVSGETNSGSQRFSGSFSANRVTEEWKVSFSASSSYSETTYDYPDIDYSATNIRRDYDADGMVVKALAPKWSLGLSGSARTSTYYNYDFEGTLSPVLEYSFFPYEESTRRSVTLQYALVGTYADYKEETVYFETKETYVTESLTLNLNFTQPWGTAYSIFSAANHLGDLDKHHASVFGGVNLRLSRGLSLNLSASYSRIHDRISVAAGAGDTPEEILLRRRQLQTDYSYRTSVGLTYRFGSIFNNVVNPRLGGGGGMGIGMIIIG
ncbi:hypothetical protein ACFL3Z_02415 [Gemmatimonadota bacterium]